MIFTAVLWVLMNQAGQPAQMPTQCEGDCMVAPLVLGSKLGMAPQLTSQPSKSAPIPPCAPNCKVEIRTHDLGVAYEINKQGVVTLNKCAETSNNRINAKDGLYHCYSKRELWIDGQRVGTIEEGR